MGNQSGIAASLSRLASIASVDGRFDDAEQLAREASTAALAGGSQAELAFSNMILGDTLEKLGRFSEAFAVSQKSLHIYIDMGNHIYMTEVHSLLSSINLHIGCYEKARDHAEISLAQAREHGPRYCVGLNQVLLGCISIVRGAFEQAYELIRDGVDKYLDLGGDFDGLSWALSVLALSAYKTGDLGRTRDCLYRAFATAVEHGVISSLVWTLSVTALFLAGESEYQRAIELYAMASRYPLVATSRWFADVAGNQLDDVITELTAEQVTMAKHLGQARDLTSTVAELLNELRSVPC